MGPKLHPPRPSVKTHSKITQGKKNKLEGQNKSEDRGVFFRTTQSAPKHHDPPHKPPRSHHQITTPNSCLFPKPPQKTRKKDEKTTPWPVSGFFFAKLPHPEPHPAAQAADKDTREAACI
jgi:hypothetical protein